jgi:BirA family biotin operon repressor/biotin-[acetyl-CoA-carboxylase] ligase
LNETEAAVSTTPTYLNTEQVLGLLDTEFIGKADRFVFLPIVDSTNILAMKLAQQGSEEGVIVLTDSQKAGKGRQGRRWVDRAGCNVLLSLLLHPLFPPHLLVMVASLAVVDTITTISGIAATIKWPNDVLIGERKVAGILIETSHDLSGRLVTIVGIGVNANGHISNYADQVSDSSLSAQWLSEKATTLAQECGHELSREAFIAHLLLQIERSYLALQQEANIMRTANEIPSLSISRSIREKWSDRLSTLGRAIQVRQGDTLLSGVAEGVNENGELLLRCHSGERISITWGDIG